MRKINVKHVAMRGNADDTFLHLLFDSSLFPLRISSLHFTRCYRITDDGWNSIAVNCGKSLETLIFENCYSIENSGLVGATNQSSKLKSLELNFCSAITDDGLVGIAQNCTNLTKLSLIKCRVRLIVL